MIERRRSIGVGEIWRTGSEQLSAHGRVVTYYLAAMAPLNAIANYIDANSASVGSDLLAPDVGFNNGTVGLLVLLVDVVAQYFLIRQMLPHKPDPGSSVVARVLGFVGLGIVSSLGVIIATAIFFIPGLIVGARWLMCVCFYVGEERGVFESLGTSWERSRGNTTSISLAIFVLLVLLILASVVLAAIPGLGFGSGDRGWLAYFFEALVGEAFAVALIALSVGTYTLLEDQGERLAETFA